MKTAIIFACSLVFIFLSEPLTRELTACPNHSKDKWDIVASACLKKIFLPDSLSEYAIFRSRAHRRLNDFEKQIDAFYLTLNLQSKEMIEKKRVELQQLERKNARLRQRIESYKPEDDLEDFKRLTTLALDAFGKEIANLTNEL